MQSNQIFFILHCFLFNKKKEKKTELASVSWFNKNFIGADIYILKKERRGKDSYFFGK